MKILYFASLRERLNRNDQTVVVPDGVTSVNQLIDWLGSEDEAFALAFENREIIKVALDEELADHNAQLGDTQNIAFFPPMTGG